MKRQIREIVWLTSPQNPPVDGHVSGNGSHQAASFDGLPESKPLTGNSSSCLSAVAPFLDTIEQSYPKRPAVDERFTTNTVHAPVADGRSVIRKHHTLKFDEVFGAIHAKLLGFLESMEANYAALLASVAALEAQLGATQRDIDVPGTGVPWTTWPRCKVAVILVLSVFFVVVDMNSVATTLAESGIASFQSPMRAWFFSMVPVGLSLGLKMFYDRLDPKLDRRIYAAGLNALGVVFALLWLGFFAATFPGIAKSSAEILNSLNLSAPMPEGGHSTSWLLLSGLAAAACVAAASWIAVEVIIDTHRIATRVTNPAFLKTQKDLNELRPIVEQQAVLVHRARKLVQRIEKDLEDYLAEADNLYSSAETGIAFARDTYRRLFQNS
jgi:hypothetical protein